MKFSINTADTTHFWLGILMLVGAAVIPALIILAWVLLFKKNRRQRRRRRHDTGVMNPTLDRTGGLPPIRKPGDAGQPQS
ncbi:MAG TPA: hypothetical protein VMO20_06420 [Candidatus Acidoferrum sp.]|jgi:hypothetical protein|nr:hypothetical protein [Candidatus Acidoferrum sp.]